MDGARRTTFMNPQSGLYDRIAAVKAVAGDVPWKGASCSRATQVSERVAEVDAHDRFVAVRVSAVERMVASTVERFDDSWKRLKGAVAPSGMNQQRLF